MNNRELLELSAKAAGIKGIWNDHVGCLVTSSEKIYWNPLTDDGDALRLAVCLNINLSTNQREGEKYLGVSQATTSNMSLEVQHRADPYWATRRAIVKTAAKLGKNL